MGVQPDSHRWWWHAGSEVMNGAGACASLSLVSCNVLHSLAKGHNKALPRGLGRRDLSTSLLELKGWEAVISGIIWIEKFLCIGLIFYIFTNPKTVGTKMGQAGGCQAERPALVLRHWLASISRSCCQRSRAATYR